MFFNYCCEYKCRFLIKIYINQCFVIAEYFYLLFINLGSISAMVQQCPLANFGDKLMKKSLLLQLTSLGMVTLFASISVLAQEAVVDDIQYEVPVESEYYVDEEQSMDASNEDSVSIYEQEISEEPSSDETPVCYDDNNYEIPCE